MGYVVECVDGWNRIMVGPFADFEAAYEWMTKVGAKRYDSCVIHKLCSITKHQSQLA